MFGRSFSRVASTATRSQAQKVSSVVTTTFTRNVKTVNPPDLFKMHNKPVWRPEGVDHEPLPVPDVDDRRTDNEEEYDEFDNSEINAILDSEYVEPEINGIFRQFQKLMHNAEPVRFFNKDILIHPTLKKGVYTFFEQAESTEHYDALIEASWRCQELDFFEDILAKCAEKGHTISLKNLRCYLNIATYHRSMEIYNMFLAKAGDKATWDEPAYLQVIGFHEMMADYATADALYSEAVEAKVILAPWRPLWRSHWFARREATSVPARHPMWDAKPPMADVLHMRALPILQARVALRYALYSFQGIISSELHKPPRVPHNLVVQCVVRHARSVKGPQKHKHWEWAPMKHQLMDYLKKHGVECGQISDAGNLFYIDRSTFDKLPTPTTLK